MTPDIEVIGLDRLKDHYKHCIRLSASNKINPKNAFDLQLIDYMQDLVSSTEDGQMNFKVASSALDVGAKIYSNRVDRIQSEAQKVASSILMALDGQEGKNSDNADSSRRDGDTSNASDRMNDSRDDHEAQTKATKKKRSTRKSIKTIVEDENQLDAKLEKIVLGDAFLDGLSQDYDMSCPAALICYNALTQPSCLLTIESSYLRKDYTEPPITSSASIIRTIEEGDEGDSQTTQVEGVENKEDNSEDQEMVDESHPTSSDKQASTNATSITNSYGQVTDANHSTDLNIYVTLITKNVNCAQIIRNNLTNHICPRLENFLFNDRTTTISGLNSNLDDSISSPMKEQNNPNKTGGAHEFNPELYDNNDCGDDHFGDPESGCEDGENQVDRNENDLIPNLDKIAASKPSEYCYSTEHHRLLNTWAGPHAWRALKAPQTAKKDAPKSMRKRAKLEQKPIDFEEAYSTSVEKIADKDIRHSADVIRRWKKPLLPQDHNLTEESIRSTLVHTFLRPEDTYHCTKTPADALKVVDQDHDYTKTDRDFDDPPATPGLAAFDDVHDDSDDEFRADPIVDGSEVAVYGAPINNTLEQLEFAGENLIEQPYTVTQVTIPFAKIAKKMDVRKLKRVMWDLLLPAEKRLELSMQAANNSVIGKSPAIGDEDNEMNISGENGHNLMVSGDEHNETVIMRVETGAQDATKKTPSPSPSESAVHLEFSHLYIELPLRVSSKMASDLSQPIAFVTLLHLANEKNLRLIPKKDLRDFIIEQDELN